MVDPECFFFMFMIILLFLFFATTLGNIFFIEIMLHFLLVTQIYNFICCVQIVRRRADFKGTVKNPCRRHNLNPQPSDPDSSLLLQTFLPYIFLPLSCLHIIGAHQVASTLGTTLQWTPWKSSLRFIWLTSSEIGSCQQYPSNLPSKYNPGWMLFNFKWEPAWLLLIKFYFASSNLFGFF